MSALVLALVLGCSQAPPAALPPPLHHAATSSGRMVRLGAVQGFVARPLAAGTGRSGTLLLVDALGAASQAAATALAEQGGVALAVAPPVDEAQARVYLAGMPDVATVTVRCLRATCPGAAR